METIAAVLMVFIQVTFVVMFVMVIICYCKVIAIFSYWNTGLIHTFGEHLYLRMRVKGVSDRLGTVPLRLGHNLRASIDVHAMAKRRRSYAFIV